MKKKPFFIACILLSILSVFAIDINAQTKKTTTSVAKLVATGEDNCNWRYTGRSRYNFLTASVELEMTAYCTINRFTGYQTKWVSAPENY